MSRLRDGDRILRNVDTFVANAILAFRGAGMNESNIIRRLIRAAGLVDDEGTQALLIEAADEIEHLRSLLPADTDEPMH